MSMEKKAEQPDNQSEKSDSTYTFECNWHIKLDGYWKDINSEYFADYTPNDPPLMAVPERLAANIEIHEDQEVINQLCDWIYEDDPEKYTEVFKITFNDFSTWHIPLKPWSKDYARTRENTVKRYVPEVVKWEAIIAGRDPEKALSEHTFPWEDTDPEWFDDFEHFEFDEETRQWYNENADWLPYIDEIIKSDGEEVDIEIDEGDDWIDDW